MVFNEMGNLRKSDLPKSLPKSNGRTVILLWGPRWNKEPQGCGQAGKWVVQQMGCLEQALHGTALHLPPLAERPHMQAGAHAHTEGKGFGAPEMHLRALEMQVTLHAASVLCGRKELPIVQLSQL